MKITPGVALQMKRVTLKHEMDPIAVLAELPNIRRNPYLGDGSKNLLMALAGAAFATKGVIWIPQDELDQISGSYVDVMEEAPDDIRIIIKL